MDGRSYRLRKGTSTAIIMQSYLDSDIRVMLLIFHPLSDRIGSDRIGSDRIGSDRIGSDRIGSDRIGSDRRSAQDIAGKVVNFHHLHQPP